MHLTRVLLAQARAGVRFKFVGRRSPRSGTSAKAAAAAAAAAPVFPVDAEGRLTYLDGFPRPGPAETIQAIPRDESGSKISVKERKAGRVPAILFEQEGGEHGGNKRLISVQDKQMKKLVNAFGYSFFLSRLFDLQVRPSLDSDEIIEEVRVFPRLLHLHPATDAVINVTFMRAPPSALIKVDVPLRFRGEDVAPGLRKGGYLNILQKTVKYLCPADIIPPYIDVDISELDAGGKVTVEDLKVHPALKLIPGKHEPVVKIMGTRIAAVPVKK